VVMDKQNAKYWFLQTALSFQNTLYRWGGDDPSGLDCSGLVVECLKSVGLMRNKADATANQLFLQHKANEVTKPTEGCLAFWFDGATDLVTHVAVCLDEDVCLTAGGGGSHIYTREDAIRQNAFVKIRPIDHRRSKPKYIDLFQ